MKKSSCFCWNCVLIWISIFHNPWSNVLFVKIGLDLVIVHNVWSFYNVSLLYTMFCLFTEFHYFCCVNGFRFISYSVFIEFTLLLSKCILGMDPIVLFIHRPMEHSLMIYDISISRHLNILVMSLLSAIQV